MPTPTPSRGTPIDAADPQSAPQPFVGELPITAPEPKPEPADKLSRGRRLLRMVRGQLPYLLVLLTMSIGLLRIVQYHWREGSAWIGGALLIAALLRAVLPPRAAGMVAVRGRAVDVLWCVGLAVCILFVAYTLKA